MKNKIIYTLIVFSFFLSGCEYLYQRTYEIKPPQSAKIINKIDVFFDEKIWDKKKYLDKTYSDRTSDAKQYVIRYRTNNRARKHEELFIDFLFLIDTKNSIRELRVVKSLVHQDLNKKERKLILKLFNKIKKELENGKSKLLERELDNPYKLSIDL